MSRYFPRAGDAWEGVGELSLTITEVHESVTPMLLDPLITLYCAPLPQGLILSAI